MKYLLILIIFVLVILDSICIEFLNDFEVIPIINALRCIQIILVVWHICLPCIILCKNFENIYKLTMYNFILRLMINIFYISTKTLTTINNTFYILSFVNIGLSGLLPYLIKKKDEIRDQEKITIVIGSGDFLGDSEDICPICVNPFKNTKVYRTICNHIFHINCIKQYVYYSNKLEDIKCPNCREKLFSV